MKIIAFITEYAVVDRIIDHLKLRLITRKLPSRVIEQVAQMAAEEPAEDYS